jgi:uncharacterized protein
MEPFDWPQVSEFHNRVDELAALDRWWSSPEKMPMSVYGRRRCGKSWLLRRFAHGKPAMVLVARRTTPGAQLDAFATKLEPVLGVRPVVDDLAELFRLLFRAAHDRKLLVVIDEFPYLLPTGETETERELSAIQAVMEEERAGSQLKLVLCGSLVAQMESLLAERGPLHGRLVPLQLHPLAFADARLFLAGLAPLDQFERYAIAGGMPRYLSVFGHAPATRDAVCKELLDRNSALWDEGRTVLEQELREPKVYFAVLQALAAGDKEINAIVQAVRSDSQRVSRYLSVLEDMRIVERRLPIGADRTSRMGHWHLRDPFFRFWFRFVFPYQDELESGLRPVDLFDTEVAPELHDHIAPEFEDFCRRWTRQHHGETATTVGSWWGRALDTLRRSGERQAEEIDIVGMARNRVSLVGEARWRSASMGPDILDAIDRYKLPALRQSGLKVGANPLVLLFSRGGYLPSLVARAAEDERVTLVDVASALGGQ